MNKLTWLLIPIILMMQSCGTTQKQTNAQTPVNVDMYTPFTLTTDLSQLTESERKMLPYLVQAADIMNGLFWYEAYGKREVLLGYLKGDARKFAEINYGPWDRLNGNKPFVKGLGEKPLGANFYPTNMSKEEFNQANLKDKNSQYTFLRRDNEGKLITVPYHEMFSKEVKIAANLLRKAATYAEDKGLKNYLLKRANALETDAYYESDLAWMNMKDNTIDIVIGPIENYEDKLFGVKSAHEAYVLVKDKQWSKKLEKYTAYLPELQSNLPVDATYKAEKPGTDSDLNAYDVVYYAGDCNAGSKTIAINLPNDEKVQLEKGTRRLQLKNAMQAKFDKILLPISNELIDPSQRKHVKFDAFFANTMFHEVAHGLGIKNTVNGKGTVREALKEHASALEEGKADILGLYMVNQLLHKAELEGDIKDYMVTFMAGIFRSVRFGASSAHGTANMIRFNYFKEKGAFAKNADGTYRVDFDKMEVAMNDLSALILKLQGNGDYAGVAKLVETKGVIPTDLQKDLDRLNHAGIPVDVVFNQGMSYLK
ncbi:Zn-dependent hydrolase [Flavobacteriaceae bacterium Ap0902]|nr:Zn-dependent hydrolase [Flavobacteriaceae bacterium Ap0902]